MTQEDRDIEPGRLTLSDYKKHGDAVLKQHRGLFEALRKSYSVDGRTFRIGEEHFLAPDELRWLNQKLTERHCMSEYGTSNPK